MKLTCKFCRYGWNYNGRMTLYATCPNCRCSVKIKGEEQEKTSVPLNDQEKEDES